MQDTENKVKENEVKEQTNKFKQKWKLITIITILLFFAGFLLRLYIISLPISGDNLYCEYKGKFNKIRCVQTGDIVPDWLDLDENTIGTLFDGKVNYSMLLIFTQDSEKYITLKMVDKVFVTDLRRKFIYEKTEQTLEDYSKFKNFVSTSKMSNWGSIALYCSNSNLSENICKELKKNHK